MISSHRSKSVIQSIVLDHKNNEIILEGKPYGARKEMIIDNLVALHFEYDIRHMTATAGSDVVQLGRPIFDDFFQNLRPYIGNNTTNVVFQMVKRLWLIRIDQ
ncbi:adhesion G protein-coupled receptor B2 [Trichonephila clavipes]|nr:adhesion G protein-coupled receptor B2 [Trichonephila clavipes]